MIKFYREDGVSRVSSNSKDTIQINHDTVPIRYMEMSVLDAFHLFDERFPGLVGHTTFYSSRPRDVKILSPHDTCICIIHENFNLLITVCLYLPTSTYCLETLISLNYNLLRNLNSSWCNIAMGIYNLSPSPY